MSLISDYETKDWNWNAGTMAQLFDVGKEECSVIFLWTYLVAALALTIWSTIFMWILS